MSEKKRIPATFLIPACVMLLGSLPFLIAAAPVLAAPTFALRLAALALAPISFCISYLLLAAALSLPFQGAITKGKFPRDLQHEIYGPRRLYGLCWGAVFYFAPLYYAFLSVPTLRRLLLWSFGYRGSPLANIAPDAWLRDLPMLSFGEGAYVANKSTVGTNMCLSDNTILVDRVTLGKNAMMGHLSMVAPGSTLGDGAELGVGAALGVRTRIGARAKIGPKSGVGHGARIGDEVEIGTMSYIGIKVRIADGIKLPGGSTIPEGADIRTPEDLMRLFESESALLQRELTRLRSVYQTREQDEPGSVASVQRMTSKLAGGM